MVTRRERRESVLLSGNQIILPDITRFGVASRMDDHHLKPTFDQGGHRNLLILVQLALNPLALVGTGPVVDDSCGAEEARAFKVDVPILLRRPRRCWEEHEERQQRDASPLDVRKGANAGEKEKAHETGDSGHGPWSERCEERPNNDIQAKTFIQFLQCNPKPQALFNHRQSDRDTRRRPIMTPTFARRRHGRYCFDSREHP